MTPTIQVRLALESSQFTARIASATGSLKRLLSYDVGQAMGGWMAGRLAPAALAAGFGMMARRTYDWADALQAMSQRTGVSTTTLQIFERAAQKTNTSLEVYAQALRRLAVAQMMARAGTGASFDSFRVLGVNLQQIRTLRPEQLFMAIARYVERTELNAEQLTAAMQVMGRAADQILPAMREGLAGIVEASETSGKFVSEEVIERLAAQKEQWDAAMASLRAGIAPILTYLDVSLYAIVTTIGSAIDGLIAIFSKLMNFVFSAGISPQNSPLNVLFKAWTGQTVYDYFDQVGKNASSRTKERLEGYGERFAPFLADAQVKKENRSMQRKLEAASAVEAVKREAYNAQQQQTLQIKQALAVAQQADAYKSLLSRYGESVKDFTTEATNDLRKLPETLRVGQSDVLKAASDQSRQLTQSLIDLQRAQPGALSSIPPRGTAGTDEKLLAHQDKFLSGLQERLARARESWIGRLLDNLGMQTSGVRMGIYQSWGQLRMQTDQMNLSRSMLDQLVAIRRAIEGPGIKLDMTTL